MTPEQLFVHTIEDLEARLELHKGEYDALMMAWLLRKLLLGGERSLLNIVGRDRAAPVFDVVDEEAPPRLVGHLLLFPGPNANVVHLSASEFVNRRVLGVVDDINDVGSPSRFARVRDLIAFLANTVGAVHVSRPTDPLERLLWEWTWSASYVMPGGQYSGPVAALIDVAQVAHTALEPLRIEIRDEIWPPGLPDWARRVARRPRDPELRADVDST